MDTAVALAAIALPLALYLRHVNNGMSYVPEEAIKLSASPWTEEDIKETYQRLCEKPIDYTPHLPPALQRRYLITGGSGLVGGYLVLHLLARGQPPQSIRIVDFRRPVRSDMKGGKVEEVDFVQADITSMESTEAAFSRPWPSDVAAWPLTVFHTAAVIRSNERAEIFMSRCASVNVAGAANVLAASRKAGVDVFIATSSASISLRPVRFWIPPWQSSKTSFVQVYPEPDQDKSIRPHGEYFANYAMTKAQAEDLVMKAHEKSFKTGCIRPAIGVYGNEYDICFGLFLGRGKIETWLKHIRQNFVYAENVSLSHLQYESALLNPASTAGGKTFVITDPNPPPAHSDVYRVLNILTGFPTISLPPVLMLTMGHLLELYCLALAYVPLLGKFLSEPTGPIRLIQPALMVTTTVNQFTNDLPARRSIEDGGLGYKGVCTTLEGMCDTVRRFNQQRGKK